MIQIGFITAILLVDVIAQADLVHLKGGAVVDIGWEYRISGERLIIQWEAGTIALPVSDVERIEKTERKGPSRSLSVEQNRATSQGQGLGASEPEATAADASHEDSRCDPRGTGLPGEA